MESVIDYVISQFTNIQSLDIDDALFLWQKLFGNIDID